MRKSLFKSFLLFITILNLPISSKGIDSLEYNISIKYYCDLSDTHRGGNLFSVEFAVIKSLYGMKTNLGLFQSHPSYSLKAPIEDTGQTIEIHYDELINMQIGSLSGFIRPIREKWFSIDLVAGICFSQTQSMFLRKLDFNYSLAQEKFLFINRDYQFVRKSHFGYQFGLDSSFFITKKIGIQMSTTMQTLHNGGTFFFAGGGLLFKL